MIADINKKIRLFYDKITKSIAFYPAIIAVGFLLLSWIMLKFDFSEAGKNIKSNLSWLSLKDADTARNIISTIAAAILSLTVFSFSMVMIVLNQAASQMSNRVLSSMIGNRFQQTILGFYIGTIVYALFLLSTIRDISSGIYVPALSIYLLIFLTVVDIFLFIYFLDYVTQTVKYETVIHRVQSQTRSVMEKSFTTNNVKTRNWSKLPYVEIKIENSGYFQTVNIKNLLEIGVTFDLHFQFLHEKGVYLLKDMPLVKVYSNTIIDKKLHDKIFSEVYCYNGQPIDVNAIYGFKQLAEIAIKALSPGINDPGTAVLAMQSLFDLFLYFEKHDLQKSFVDDNDVARLFIPSISFEDLFRMCIFPIWNYGKKDQYIRNELSRLLSQVQTLNFGNEYKQIFTQLTIQIENENQISAMSI